MFFINCSCSFREVICFRSCSCSFRAMSFEAGVLNISTIAVVVIDYEQCL